MNYIRRAKLKIGAAGVGIVLFSIAMDVPRLGDDSTFMRFARIISWVFLAFAPWIAIRLPQFHRVWGGMASVAFVLALVVVIVALRAGFSPVPLLWVAGGSGLVAYVFLFDRDVRRFRDEQMQQLPRAAQDLPL